MTMNYQQAVDQATKLHNQGMTYPKIEEHLRNAGYTSSRTKKPVGALAVRHMVTQNMLRDKKEKKLELKEDQKEEQIMVTSSKRGIQEAMKAILDLDALEYSVKSELLSKLIEKLK